MSSMSPEPQYDRRHDDKDPTSTKTPAQIGKGIVARDVREQGEGRKGPLQLRKTDDRTAIIAGITQHFEDKIGDPTDLPEETPITFDDLSTLLAPQGVDLTKELETHISFMVNGGALAESEVEAYKKRFETIHVRADELAKIPAGYRPLLFVDNVTPVEAAKKFITAPGVNLFEYVTLADFNQVNLHRRKPLKNQTPSGNARLTFTPNVTNLTSDFTSKSANTHLEQMTQLSAHYLQPQQWFQLFNESLQRAITELNLNNKLWKNMDEQERKTILNNRKIDSHLPDTTTWTQCPQWRNTLGSVLCLYWNPGTRGVRVGCGNPVAVYPDLGPRPALG